MFAREMLKITFSFIVLFREEKYQKSYKRAFAPCLGDANQRFALLNSPTTRYLVGANIVRPRRNIKELFSYRTFV